MQQGVTEQPKMLFVTQHNGTKTDGTSAAIPAVLLKPIRIGACLLAMAGFVHANLIVNGSFESGDTSFSSDYSYCPTPVVPPRVINEAEYGIIQSLNQAHSAWAALGSLAAQSGVNYFVANGAPDNELSPWMQDVTVNPEDVVISSSNAPIYYRFQAYIASVYPDGAQPQLAFEMSFNDDGRWQSLTTSTAPTNAYQWFLTYRDGYFVTAPSNISFRLRNTVTDAFGNDLAVDSIYFGCSTNAPAYGSNPINSIGAITGIPEPGTWAAALFAGTAGYVRSRRRHQG